MTADEQQAALTLALTGDVQAKGHILGSLRPYVRVLVRALRKGRIPERLDDSDLIQDALLEANRHFGRFQGKTVPELLAWLRPVVLRTAGHTLRAQLSTDKRGPDHEDLGEDLNSQADPGSTPSEIAMRLEQTAQLADGLARLPEEMQQVLLGRHIDDLPYAELARRMERSEGAVRVLYTRALRRLRQECGE